VSAHHKHFLKEKSKKSAYSTSSYDFQSSEIALYDDIPNHYQARSKQEARGICTL
jgi:hypothetical protein